MTMPWRDEPARTVLRHGDGLVAPQPCLVIPGLGNSGPDHWQTRWERRFPHCRRAELGDWDDPHPRQWADRLSRCVRASPDGVILVAHSLGCHAVTWWVATADHRDTSRAGGAILVAPPDVVGSADARLRRFALPSPVALPFPTIVVASTDDPYATTEWSSAWAERHDAEWMALHGAGHINAASGLGDWIEGQRILARLGRGGQSGISTGPEPTRYPGPPQS